MHFLIIAPKQQDDPLLDHIEGVTVNQMHRESTDCG